MVAKRFSAVALFPKILLRHLFPSISVSIPPVESSVTLAEWLKNETHCTTNNVQFKNHFNFTKALYRKIFEELTLKYQEFAESFRLL